MARTHLCSGLSKKEVEAVAAIASVRKAAKGKILFLEGDRAAGFYVLLSGRVRIYKASPDGKEYTIHIIKPGQLFAEAALFQGEAYPANGEALEDSLVAFFPKVAFQSLLRNSPEISLKIITSLSAFVRDFNRQVEELSLREVPARIASYLLIESERLGKNTVELDISKLELANRLGTISETLSRNFKKLSDLRIIVVEGKTITILDLPRLEAVADGEKI